MDLMNQKKGAKVEQLRVDPTDARRHAARRRQRERASPAGKLVRYLVVAVGLVALFAAYRNFDTLRGIAADWSAAARPPPSVSDSEIARGEPAVETVEPARVAGTATPTSVGEAPPAPVARAAEAPEDAVRVAASGESARTESAAAASAPPPPETALEPPPPPPEPEPPPGPESFEFGLNVVHVSEAAASAAVLILRNGDRRRASTIVWWTMDGTAAAGADYANLGRVEVRFAPSEQNRTIHIPIVGDRNVEGPETFYVFLAADRDADSAAAGVERLEVVIDDDD